MQQQCLLAAAPSLHSAQKRFPAKNPRLSKQFNVWGDVLKQVLVRDKPGLTARYYPAKLRR